MDRDILLGVELSASQCRGLMVSMTGHGSNYIEIKLPGFSVDEVLDVSSSVLMDLTGKCKSDGWRIVDVGMAVQASIDNDGIVRSALNYPHIVGHNFAELFSSHVDFPVKVYPRGRAVTVAENIAGGAKNLQNCLVISADHSVTGGFVLNGSVYAGANNLAGRVGHICVKPNGRRCLCGQAGCLQSYLSVEGILETHQILEEISPHRYRGNYNTKDFWAILQAAGRGEDAAKKTFEITGQKLGVAIATLSTVLDIDSVVLNGIFVHAIDHMNQGLQEELQRGSLISAGSGIQIRNGKLMEKAGCVGAALLSYTDSIKLKSGM